MPLTLSSRPKNCIKICNDARSRACISAHTANVAKPFFDGDEESYISTLLYLLPITCSINKLILLHFSLQYIRTKLTTHFETEKKKKAAINFKRLLLSIKSCLSQLNLLLFSFASQNAFPVMKSSFNLVF